MSSKQMGRPKIEIDYEQVNKLIELHCTGEEVASVLGISYDTLARRIEEEYGITFAEHIKNNSGKGKASLRRLMWASAEKGNPVMMIWLSKQHLGMTDKQEITLDTDAESVADAFKNVTDTEQ